MLIRVLTINQHIYIYIPNKLNYSNQLNLSKKEFETTALVAHLPLFHAPVLKALRLHLKYFL
jgi:hypothetical protein